jgi:hypothetical protein
MASIHTAPSYAQLWYLFCAAFIVRALFFYCFMLQTTADHIHYHQADSNDYHLGALCIALGNGMSTPGNNQPMFWRTPGYPAYLAWFYNLHGIRSGDFNENHAAQRMALWVQLLLCSFIPLIILYLAHLLTRSWPIAWLSSIIAVFHIGLVLASTYLLTEGIGMIFFYLFLLFLFKLLLDPSPHWVATCLMTTLMLSIFTWIRPMGEFVGILTMLLIAGAAPGTWQKRIVKSVSFAAPFFISLLPWYIRNYRLTGQWFYCPLSGIYLNVFCAPKILRRTMNIPLIDAWKYTQQQARHLIEKAYANLQGTALHVSPLLSKKIAVPIIVAYPLYFCLDWIKEACKTAFDLYSSQLTAYAKGTFWFDPLEEFVTEKIAECLWAQVMPFWMRSICRAEMLFSIIVWLGLLGGLWHFVLAPLYRMQPLTADAWRVQRVWILSALITSAIIGMTGGFGYARLRLPVEPLMFILSLQSWATLGAARPRSSH